MMRDIVALRVNNQEISNFQSYSIEADLYTAADGFTLELSDPLLPVTAGSVVELYINGARELIGTIDARKPYNDKRGSRLTLTGGMSAVGSWMRTVRSLSPSRELPSRPWLKGC